MRLEVVLIDEDGNRFEGSAHLQPVKGGHRGSARRTPSEATNKTSALPRHILQLRNSEFFSEARTPSEVHAELQGSYPCDLNRVEVALLRLQKRGHLRKTSKQVGKRRQVAYAW